MNHVPGVGFKALKVRITGQMDKAVGKWRGHIKDGGAILFAIARRPDKPAFGHDLRADARSRINVGPSPASPEGPNSTHPEREYPDHRRQKFRWIPARDTVVRHRQATKIGRCQLREA